jgi:hypothetical protein
MIRAYVDSVSGDQARVLIGEEGVAVAIPLHELPPGSRTGTTFRVRFTIDQAASPTKDRKES